MERSEAASLVAMLQAAYQREMPEPTARLYTEFIADLDAEQAGRTVRLLIATSKFLPSIAEIRAAAVEDQGYLLPDEAWPFGLNIACGRPNAVDLEVDAWVLVADAVDAVGEDLLRFSEISDPRPRQQFINAYKALLDKRVRASVVEGLALPPKPQAELTA